jgi:SNF-related kinase
LRNAVHFNVTSLIFSPSLQQIANDSWLLEECQQNQPEYLPLASKTQVSDDDHSFIVQKMVNGNIAQKDEILE